MRENVARYAVYALLDVGLWCLMTTEEESQMCDRTKVQN
jgi:hypothetical protein